MKKFTRLKKNNQAELERRILAFTRELRFFYAIQTLEMLTLGVVVMSFIQQLLYLLTSLLTIDYLNPTGMFFVCTLSVICRYCIKYWGEKSNLLHDKVTLQKRNVAAWQEENRELLRDITVEIQDIKFSRMTIFEVCTTFISDRLLKIQSP